MHPTITSFMTFSSVDLQDVANSTTDRVNKPAAIPYTTGYRGNSSVPVPHRQLKIPPDLTALKPMKINITTPTHLVTVSVAFSPFH